MRVAVVTPYYKEPRAWLERCIESVRQQTHPCEHILVSDGNPNDWIDAHELRHVQLGRSHGDYGNTPRGVGALLAASESFDAVCFLDADNWYQPDHVARCAATAEATGADYVVSGRHLVREDGSIMDITVADELNAAHVDTNCFFLTFPTFHTLARWAIMPKPMSMWGDRFYLKSLRQEGLKEAHTRTRTVNYLCTWSSFYRALGETPPAFAKEAMQADQLVNWVSRLTPGDKQIVARMTGVEIG
jgi:glycosyltransferase involved in cell wall biosynthesis